MNQSSFPKQSQGLQPKVLMYHGIVSEAGDIPPEREPGAELYDVGHDVFREQMVWIRDQGVFVSTLTKQTDMGGRHPLVLTFDDGMMNNFTRAWPVLREFHFPAYFFITVARIGQPGYMAWENLRELQDHGMIIGSHGMTHQLLVERSREDVGEELHKSRQILQENLGASVECFSIPRGFADRYVIDQAREAGYRHIFTSQPRCFGGDGCIGRVAVKSSWSRARFRSAVAGRTPLAEKVAGWGKDAVISLLGPGRYDRWRARWMSKGSDA